MKIPGHRLLSLFFYYCAFAALCLWGADAYRHWQVESTSGFVLTLPGPDRGATYYRDDTGKWKTFPVTDSGTERRILEVETSVLGGDGRTEILVNMPAWMVPEDDTPPVAENLVVQERPYSVGTAEIDLGSVPRDELIVKVRARDAKNPLMLDDVLFETEATEDISVTGVPEGELPSKLGSLTVRAVDLDPGMWHASLTVRDASPRKNPLVLKFAFSVAGMSYGESAGTVRICSGTEQFLFQAQRHKQLLFPGGVWAKLTTWLGSQWYYPLSIIRIGESRTENAYVVTIRTDLQDIDGHPAPQVGMIDYEFTTYPGLPGITVRSQSAPFSDGPIDSKVNWGWLPAPYYVVPEGRRSWRGKAENSYITVGNVGWVWLPNRRDEIPGLVWVSGLSFGESRFDTMLLYGGSGKIEQGKARCMGFHIAPAESADRAREIYEMLREIPALSDILAERHPDQPFEAVAGK